MENYDMDVPVFNTDIFGDLRETANLPPALDAVPQSLRPIARRRALTFNHGDLFVPSTGFIEQPPITPGSAGHTLCIPFGAPMANSPHTPCSATSSSAPLTPDDDRHVHSSADKADAMLVEDDQFGFSSLAAIQRSIQCHDPHSQTLSVPGTQQFSHLSSGIEDLPIWNFGEEMTVSSMLQPWGAPYVDALTPNYGAPNPLPANDHLIAAAHSPQQATQQDVHFPNVNNADGNSLGLTDMSIAPFSNPYQVMQGYSPVVPSPMDTYFEHAQTEIQPTAQHIQGFMPHVGPKSTDHPAWVGVETTVPILRASAHSGRATPLAGPSSSNDPILGFGDSRRSASPLANHNQPAQYTIIQEYIPRGSEGGNAQEQVTHPPPYVPQLRYVKPGQYNPVSVDEIRFGSGLFLKDVLEGRFDDLPDSKAVTFRGRPSNVSVRILWPGQEPWTKTISISKKHETTKGQLASKISQRIKDFIDETVAANLPLADPNLIRWRIGTGPNDINIHNLVLVGLQHVAKGSYQPVLRVVRDRD